MSKRWQNVLFMGILAASIALVLWLTILSRLGCYTRHFYLPFSSYKAVFRGSVRALLEIAGNIILFIPVGVMLPLFFRIDLKRSLVLGFTISLIIESCQWFFWLGSFEFDDLLHNTIGAGIGAVIVQRTFLGKRLKEQIVDKKRKAF